MYKNIIKPLIDFTGAFIVLFFASPIIITVGALLFVANRGKVFFFQHRGGKDGSVFSVIKFKTMNDRKDANGELLPDHVRLTPVGKFVRKTSLDELPQLFNVLRGEMSLIGPRPLIADYLELYDKEQARRHEVKPGITGWAQVNGRNAISWEKKFEYDVWYVDNHSLLTDIRVVFKTVKKVLVSEGISAEGSVTIERFEGTARNGKEATTT